MEKTSIRAVIIDDETDGRNIIAHLANRFFPEIQLAGQAKNVAQGLALINATEPDLIFLDIEMPDGNAFDLLSACGDLRAQVILVTAYSHYAIKAIRASILDYLLKPITKDEFETAVGKALTKIREHLVLAPDALMATLCKHLTLRKVRIPTLSGFTLIDVDDIVRCEASGSYTSIFFSDHKSVLACRKLGEYEAELKQYGFIRIHHKHLININQIIEYNKGDKGGGYITLKGRETFEVSARKKTELLHLLK